MDVIYEWINEKKEQIKIEKMIYEIIGKQVMLDSEISTIKWYKKLTFIIEIIKINLSN